MKFRRGGRLARSDVLSIEGRSIEFVPKFQYLGLWITTRGNSYSFHIADRVSKALAAAWNIKKPHRLSLRIALRVFDMKLAPMASYGVEIIWGHLSSQQLIQLDRVKPSFLKRVLSLHRSAPNRLVYLLCDTPTFIDELKRRFCLPDTPGYLDFLRHQEIKFAEVNPDFYQPVAMSSEGWKSTGSTTRHLTTRFSIHGFHHKVCINNACFDPSPSCRCSYCNLPCPIYHAGECSKSPSLTQLAQ